MITQGRRNGSTTTVRHLRRLLTIRGILLWWKPAFDEGSCDKQQESERCTGHDKDILTGPRGDSYGRSHPQTGRGRHIAHISATHKNEATRDKADGLSEPLYDANGIALCVVLNEFQRRQGQHPRTERDKSMRAQACIVATALAFESQYEAQNRRKTEPHQSCGEVVFKHL